MISQAGFLNKNDSIPKIMQDTGVLIHFPDVTNAVDGVSLIYIPSFVFICRNGFILAKEYFIRLLRFF